MLQALEAIWYGEHPYGSYLAPSGWLFALGVRARRALYRARLLASVRVPVPVVVVGNITVGGTGKTPLVLWAVEIFRQRGFRPGVVSRGYRGRATRWPQQVRPDSDPMAVGDEAVMIARRSGCPVAAGPDRAAATLALVEHSDCDVVLSDDGLQHLKLARDVEIAVVDGERRLGNGRCLPAGPLREPASRLERVDFVVTNGGAARDGEVPMRLEPGAPVSVGEPGRQRTFASLQKTPVHAVCGIGNPARFFRQLESRGLEVIAHPYPDHHAFRPRDVDFGDDRPVLMTEKDAVKCARFAHERLWYVPVNAILPASFAEALVDRLARFRRDEARAG